MLRKGKKGQGLVEFAFVLPVLLLVILGIIEAGWLIFAYVTVQNSAREAARYAVTGAPLDAAGNPWTVKPMLEAGDTPGTLNRSDEIKEVAVGAARGLPIDVQAIQNQAAYDTNRTRIRAFGVSIRGQVDPDDVQGTPDHPGTKGLNILVRVYYNAPMLDPIFNVLMGGNFVQLRGEVTMQNEGINLALGGAPPDFAPPDPDQAGAGGDGSAALNEYLEVRFDGAPVIDVPAGSDVDIALERHNGGTAYTVCFEGSAIPQSPVTTDSGGNALVSNYTISLLTSPGTRTFTSSPNADCSSPVASYEVNVIDATNPSIFITDAGHTKHSWPANSLVTVSIAGHDPNTEYQILFDGTPMPDPSGGTCKITTGANKVGNGTCVIPDLASAGTHQLSTSFTTTPYDVEVSSAAMSIKGGNAWPDSTFISVILRGHAPRHAYFIYLGQGPNYIHAATVTTNSVGDAEVPIFIPAGYEGTYAVIAQDANSPLPPVASGPPVARTISTVNIDVAIPVGPVILVMGGYTWPAGETIYVTLRNHAASTKYDVDFASGTVINQMTTAGDGNTPVTGTPFKIPDAMATGTYDITSFLAGSSTVFSATRQITIQAAPYLTIDGGDRHAPQQEITIRLHNHAANSGYDVYVDIDGVAGNGPNGTDAETLIEAGIVTDNNGEAAVTYTIPASITPTGLAAANAHEVQSVRNNAQVANTDLFVVVADLEVTAITVPTDPQPGVPLPIRLSITNNEPVTVTGIPFDNDLYVNPPPGVPTYTHQLPPGDSKMWITEIGPNQTKLISTTITVFNLGTYDLHGRTDTSNKVGETEEFNNLFQTSMVVQCTLTPFEDDFGNGSQGSWTLQAFGNAGLGSGWTNPLAMLEQSPTELYGLSTYTVEPAGLGLELPPALPVAESTPAAPADGTGQLVQQAIPLAQTTTGVNFQRPQDAGPVPGFPSYLVDAGNAYGSRGGGQSYGWLVGSNPQNNFNAKNRNRAAAPDERYDTFNRLRPGGTVYKWEYALPNGQYTVRIVAGDSRNSNGTYFINAEGTPVIAGSTTTYFIDNTVTVTVNDGRLTVENGSTNNNKIAFIEITPAITLNPPTNVAATVTGATGFETIDVTWTDTNSSPNEEVYIIERSPNGTSGWTQVGQTSGPDVTTFNDNTAVCATDYYYRVIASRPSNSVQSAPSTASSAINFACQPATTCSQTSPFLEGGTGQLIMEAEHYASNVAGTGSASGKTWNELSQTDASGGVGMQAQPNTGTNVRDNTNGPQMTYYVNFTTPGNYTVYVRVKAPPNSGVNDSLHVGLDGPPATYGNIGLSDGFNNSYKWGTIAAGSPTVVTVTPAMVNQTLPFYVWMREDGTIIDKIVLKQASGAPSGTGPAESACNPPPPPYPPPSNLQAVKGADSTEVVLTWNDNTSGADQEDRFLIERSDNGGSTWTQISTVGTNVTTFTDTGRTCDQQYVYRVRAQRDSPADTSEPSNEDFIINPCPTPDPAYPPPTNVTATMNTVSAGVYTIDVTWQNQTADETELRLERTDDGGATWTQIAVLPAGTTSYNDPTVVCQTGYAYRLIAYRASPEKISNPSTASNTATTGACPVSSCDKSGELDGQLHLCSSGTSITQNDDATGGYLFMRRAVNSLSFEMIVKVNGVPNQTADSVAGLEVRDTTATNSKKVNLVIHNANTREVAAYNRALAGGAVSQVAGWTDADGDVPTWLRIVRANGKFYFYYNTRIDDQIPVIGAWNLLGSVDDSMGASVQVGLVNATGNGSLSESLWDYFRVSCVSVPTAQECGVVDESDGLAVNNAINYSDSFPSTSGSDAWQRTQTPSGSYPAVYYNGANYTEETQFNSTSYWSNGPQLEFAFNILQSGVYYVWLLGYSPDNNGDSIHIGFNGARETFLEDPGGSGLRWFYQRQTGEPYAKDLSQGVHTINFWGREDDFQLVQVLLTNQPPSRFAPTGNAPLNQSACMEPVPPEFPPNLEQCSGNLLQQPGFETGGTGNQLAWTYVNGASRAPEYRVNGSFGVNLPATDLLGYPKDTAPELKQTFNMPDWINATTKMLVSLKVAVLKTTNRDDPTGLAVNSPNDLLQLDVRDQNNAALSNNVIIADGDDNPPDGSSNIVPPGLPADDFNSVNNKDIFPDFLGTLADKKDLGGQSVTARFFAPNPSQLTPGLPDNDPSRYSTVFWMDDLSIEVCTSQEVPALDPSKGTVKGDLVVVIGSTQVRVEGVTVWAYAIDPPGPIQTTYSVNTPVGQDNYSFYNLDPGTYTIYAEFVDNEGTAYGVQRTVTVQAGGISNTDLLLRVGQ